MRLYGSKRKDRGRVTMRRHRGRCVYEPCPCCPDKAFSLEGRRAARKRARREALNGE